MENTICFFEIPVQDGVAARAFYERLFGWRFSEVKAGEGRTYLFIHPSERADALSGGLVPRLDPQHQPTIYVEVASVDEMLSQAEQAGATVIARKTDLPGLGSIAAIRDPDGNALGLFQRADEDGSSPEKGAKE